MESNVTAWMNESLLYTATWLILTNITLSKRPYAKGHILSDSIYKSLKARTLAMRLKVKRLIVLGPVEMGRDGKASGVLVLAPS